MKKQDVYIDEKEVKKIIERFGDGSYTGLVGYKIKAFVATKPESVECTCVGAGADGHSFGRCELHRPTKPELDKESNSSGGSKEFYTTTDKEHYFEGNPIPGNGSITISHHEAYCCKCLLWKDINKDGYCDECVTNLSK